MTDMRSKSTVIITGASSGIGYAAAKMYNDNGYNVIGLDLNGGNFEFPVIQCDVSNEDSVRCAFDCIRNKTTSIQYLVNCAGVFFVNHRNTIDSMSVEEWDAVYRNNTTSVLLVTKYALPLMREFAGDKAIINISSDQARYPRRRNAAYAVSKGAIEVLSKTCAVELLEESIRVNSIEIASVKTKFIRKLSGSIQRENEIYTKENEKMPLGLILPEDVAETIFFLGSEKACRITGQTLLIDSGLYL